LRAIQRGDSITARSKSATAWTILRRVIDEGFADTDNDGQADCVDTDDDNDGVLDATDNCPLTIQRRSADNDNDGIGR